ncbi:MAG: zinc permease [Actinobacteria bacterium]|nr:zinc permease [Actinomycetota bacterium]
MGQALVFGSVASAALIVGAAIGARWTLPDHLYAVLLGFAGGALTSALSFELLANADEYGGVWYAALGLIIGSATFILLDKQLMDGIRGSAVGFVLLAGAVLDGVPESLALGVSLVEGAGPALLVAIVIANLPEAVGGATRMREDGRSTRFILGIWTAAAVVIACSVVAGRLLLGGAPGGVLAVLIGFAAGAVLASLASSVLPEAFERGGSYVAFSTVAGFLVAYLLSEA